MHCGDICQRECVVVTRDDRANALARLMREKSVGAVVVVEGAPDQYRPVGILTDRDLVTEVMACELDPATVTAGDVMSVDLLSCDETDELAETLLQMRERGVRRVPVLDTFGYLAGILSTSDLISVLAGEIMEVARLSNRQAGNGHSRH